MTVWSKARDILVLDGWAQGWSKCADGRSCIGGALAEAITGYHGDLYSTKQTEVRARLQELADHVGAPVAHPEGLFTMNPEERVTWWNDDLPPESGYQRCLDALAELDALERAKV